MSYVTEDTETRELIDSLVDVICTMTHQYDVYEKTTRMLWFADNDPKGFINNVDRLLEVTERLTGLIPRRPPAKPDSSEPTGEIHV